MKTKKNKAFTLIEILLVIGITSLAAIGVYVVFKNASETSAANEEGKNLTNVIFRVQRAIGSTMSFSSINTESIGQIGGFSSKLNLVSITSPNPTELYFNYNNVAPGVCGKLITNILANDENISAEVNSKLLKSDTAPDVIAQACSNDLNTVSVIVKAKNLSSTLVKVTPTPPLASGAIPFSPVPVINHPPISTITAPSIPSVPAPSPVPGVPSVIAPPPTAPFSCAPGQTMSGYVCINPPPPMIDCAPGWARVGVICQNMTPPAPPAPDPFPTFPTDPGDPGGGA